MVRPICALLPRLQFAVFKTVRSQQLFGKQINSFFSNKLSAGFKNYLKQNRLIDDRIVHQLNTTIPTQSFAIGVNIGEECKSLHNVIEEAQMMRHTAIQKCIAMQLDKTKFLMTEREKDPDDFVLRKKLRNEQSTLRLFQQELSIEDILKQRVQAAFHERCRNYYRADQSS